MFDSISEVKASYPQGGALVMACQKQKHTHGGVSIMSPRVNKKNKKTVHIIALQKHMALDL